MPKTPSARVLDRMYGRTDDGPSDEDLTAVLARLWATPDGHAFLTWLWMRTLGRQVPDDAGDGALRAYAARNSLAALIFQVLERGLERDPRS
jgi:hypothetical protein